MRTTDTTMNDHDSHGDERLDELLHGAFDDNEARAALVTRLGTEQDARLAGMPATDRKRGRRRGGLLAAPVLLVALGVLSAVALWPAENQVDRPNEGGRPFALGSASAAPTIRELASNTVDAGAGPWRHTTVRYFSALDYSRSSDGEVAHFEPLGTDEAWARDDELVVMETQWAEAGASESPGTPPSRLQRCEPGAYGGTCPFNPDAAVFHAAPHPFPRSLEAGREALDAVAEEFNLLQSIRSSTNVTPGGIVTIPQLLDRPRVALLLATSVTYGAADRRAVLRVLAAEPGTRLLGPATDALGRRGVEVALRSTTTALTEAPLEPLAPDPEGQVQKERPIAETGPAGKYAARDADVTIRAVLDVDGGRVLSTSTHVGVVGAADVVRVFEGPERVQTGPVDHAAA